MESLKILSYNMHKGMDIVGRHLLLHKMKESLRKHDADIIFLQEAVGHHTNAKLEIENWPNNNQVEFLAHEFWDHHCYGANKLHGKGHHGNAILSKYPILDWENYDISTNPLESRGVLWASIKVSENLPYINLFCTHLNLLEGGRKKQAEKIVQFISKKMEDHHPALLCGDFNDWKMSMTFHMDDHLNFKEVHHHFKQEKGATFPSFFPKLSLDRVFYKNIEPIHAEILNEEPWNRLSDHVPIHAEFSLKKLMGIDFD